MRLSRTGLLPEVGRNRQGTFFVPYAGSQEREGFGDTPGPARCPGRGFATLPFSPTEPPSLHALRHRVLVGFVRELQQVLPGPVRRLSHLPRQLWVTRTSCSGPGSPRTGCQERVRGLPGSDMILSCVMGSSTTAERQGLAVTALLMLPSACVPQASASACCILSRLNSPPRTIPVYASPWSSPSTAQHSLPGGRYPLPGPVFHRLDHTSLLAHGHYVSVSWSASQPGYMIARRQRAVDSRLRGA